MQIFIRHPDGHTFALDVEFNDTIDNVKAQIQDQTGIAPGDQTLTYNSTEMLDGMTIADYEIPPEAEISLSLPTTAPSTTTTVPAAPTTTTTAAEATTTAAPTTAAPTTVVPSTTTAPAQVASASVSAGAQLPVTGGAELSLAVGLSLVAVGSALHRLSRRWQTSA